MRRLLVAGLLALVLLSGAARAALFRGTDGPDKLVGGPAADSIYGLAGADSIEARGGNDFVNPGFGRDYVLAGAGADRIAAQDGEVDSVACGPGADTVTADLDDAVAADCETVSRQVSRDTTTDFYAQHETQVEPDSFAWGRTIVTAFQSGRIANGGAAAIGWATSADAGARWRSGFLPLGPYRIVSDPVVAYDAAHGYWLVAALGAGSGLLDLFVHRSRDGVTWSQPLRAAGDVSEDYDKEWLTCDNNAKSKFRGNCYLAYVDTKTHWLAVRRTSDAGTTWSAPVRVKPGVDNATFSGPMPVVQPDGTVVIPYVLYAPIENAAADDRMAVVVSKDGGATYGAPTRISTLLYEEPFDLRAPTMPSADVDADGRVYVAWADARFKDDGMSMGIVLSTSPDAKSWSAPVQITRPDAGTALEFLPALAVEPGTAGRGAHLAVAYYTMKLPARCQLFVPGCAQQVDAWLTESKNGGRTWTPRRRLNADSMPLEWLADTTLGRMLGDYIGVAFAGGKANATLSLAGEPGYNLTQAIFQTR